MGCLDTTSDRVDGATAQFRFDIDLLARRLIGAIDWVRDGPGADLHVGLFGASTGAAAALVAAAARPDVVAAAVSRGGRPDLAGPPFGRVPAPMLFIVGGADEQVLELNRRVLQLLGAAQKRLVVVPGTTQHDQFVRAIMERSGIAERQEAERTAITVLQALSDRLTGEEASDLVAQLPSAQRRHHRHRGALADDRQRVHRPDRDRAADPPRRGACTRASRLRRAAAGGDPGRVPRRAGAAAVLLRRTGA